MADQSYIINLFRVVGVLSPPINPSRCLVGVCDMYELISTRGASKEVG